MHRELIYNIDAKDAGTTVGSYLRSHGYSRHLLSVLKQSPAFPYKMYEPLREGQQLTVILDEMPKPTFSEIPSDLLAADPMVNPSLYTPLSIIYEDEDILVLDKSPGMPVHQSAGHRGDTLADAVNAYYTQKNNAIVYRCINRLDRDTSGLILIAKHALSGCILSAQMKERKIHRTYTALVKGKIMQEGVIHAPIARKKGSAIMRCVDTEHGETAITHYRPLFYVKQSDITLIELTLETGRTHQIRVHMTAIGHPLLGDFLYHTPEDVLCQRNPSEVYASMSSTAGDGTLDESVTGSSATCSRETPASAPLALVNKDSFTFWPSQNDSLFISRQALHSSRLRFTHPITKEPLDFSLSLPKDMQRLIQE